MDKMKLEKKEIKKIKRKITKIKKINKIKKKNSQKLDTSPGLTTTVSFLVFRIGFTLAPYFVPILCLLLGTWGLFVPFWGTYTLCNLKQCNSDTSVRRWNPSLFGQSTGNNIVATISMIFFFFPIFSCNEQLKKWRCHLVCALVRPGVLLFFFFF